MGKKTPSSQAASRSDAAEKRSDSNLRRVAWFHVRLGWWLLLAYLTLGIALEALHALKIGYLLDVDAEPRRLMWRLAHAHGTLLSLVNIVFGLTLLSAAEIFAQRPALLSYCLAAASLLLPGGFLLGGVFIEGGDPGLGIALVPIGAALLFSAVLGFAWRLSR